MKITKEIIERIEGEATLELEWKKNKISYAKIKFLNYRAIEDILVDRHLLDALMITPRVCGICSHAHINATINAIENCYENSGVKINLTDKAKKIRELVLNAEKIQNHIKWFYFSILPELFKINKEKFILSKPFEDREWFESQDALKDALKIGSIFSGQWPHGSYVMVGGVTCDPLQSDISNAQNFLSNVYDFCENKLFGYSTEEFLEADSLNDLFNSDSSLSRAIVTMKEMEFDKIGNSYDKFISFGNYQKINTPMKAIKTRLYKTNIKFVKEDLENSFFTNKKTAYTYSKSAKYKNDFYEVGPLARLMISKDPLIRDCHRRCADSVISRIIARIKETAILLQRSKYLLENIDINEESLQTPKNMPKNITSTGTGVVEAARGSLIHKINVQDGKIKHFDIIPPTVWNLGNGNPSHLSIAQKAITGLDSIEKADFVFKSFDICSVCTTQ
ncbi:MAG: nickel-dependent hydrogenase large subunit [Campylobacteraceae bacterium]|nr:nickel-dependent hydrogenase large subunit [Campylobacteraceae bacterium]